MEEEKHEHVHHAHTHEHKEHHKKVKLKKIQMWQISVGVLGVLFIVSILTHGFGPACSGSTVAELTSDEAADKAVSYLNSNVLQGATATLKSVEEKGDLYSVKLSIQGKDYDSYITKDGNFLFPSGIDMTEAAAAPTAPTTPPSQDMPKTAKPVVDLFIMTYCPYGLQAQEGLYPVMKLLGDDAEFNIKWVPYIMHGKQEIDENTRQYCIQKGQKSKYVDYVECFVGSKDAGICGVQAGIDEAKVAACVTAADAEFNIEKNFDDNASWLSGRYPIYEVDKAEADALGVRGSPSMFINGVQYGGGRTSEAYKSAICGAFDEPPEECGEVLNSQAAAASGSCG